MFCIAKGDFPTDNAANWPNASVEGVFRMHSVHHSTISGKTNNGLKQRLCFSFLTCTFTIVTFQGGCSSTTASNACSVPCRRSVPCSSLPSPFGFCSTNCAVSAASTSCTRSRGTSHTRGWWHSSYTTMRLRRRWRKGSMTPITSCCVIPCSFPVICGTRCWCATRARRLVFLPPVSSTLTSVLC